MVTKTKNKLLEIIKINGAIAPVSLAEILNISPQAIHRHLKSLLEDGVIKRIGTPPSVFYNLSNTEQDISALVEITPKERAYIEENFSRLLPNGELLKGTLAFLSWLKLTKQTKSYKILCERYIELHKEIHSKKENGLFNLTQKIFDTFGSSNLKSIYCSDFYSLPQFGKTYLGNLITAGKSGQNKNTINEIAKIVTADIANLISSKNIDHIAWIPHSIPRKVMFLKVLRKILKLNLPTVSLLKYFKETYLLLKNHSQDLKIG